MKSENNPERYKRMAEPYKTKEEASEALQTFIEQVSRLREACRIPEVVIAAAAYIEHDDGTPIMGLPDDVLVQPVARLYALGNPDVSAELSAFAFNNFAAPLIQRAAVVKAIAEGPAISPEEIVAIVREAMESRGEEPPGWATKK